jgi:hypothetical protein
MDYADTNLLSMFTGTVHKEPAQTKRKHADPKKKAARKQARKQARLSRRVNRRSV